MTSEGSFTAPGLRWEMPGLRGHAPRDTSSAWQAAAPPASRPSLADGQTPPPQILLAIRLSIFGTFSNTDDHVRQSPLLHEPRGLALSRGRPSLERVVLLLRAAGFVRVEGPQLTERPLPKIWASSGTCLRKQSPTAERWGQRRTSRRV